MNTFTVHKSTHVKMESGDPGFTFADGYCLVSRAALEISEDCPYRTQMVIAQALEKGWLKPVAYVTRDEHTWIMMAGA